MCGIAGILVYPNQTLLDLPDRLASMAQVMLHRGPDDGGHYISSGERVGLANRRLAIRDLSPAGHMPMSNAEGVAEGDVWITYNGEIYNADELRVELEKLGYHFRSHNDVEVILHGYQAWGEGILPRLRGMFAFAILDQRSSETPNAGDHLFLARDRLGIKPLYYAWTADAFVFASELKSIQASGLVGREISPAGLVGYLMLGSVPNPWTIYRDIQALEPACCIRLDLNDPTTAAPAPYWRMPTDSVRSLTRVEAVERVRELLAESVRVRLVSDVPLGAFLSGGLDSSAVVALMRQVTSGTIRTCSMVFEEPEYSEAPYARTMAEAVGAEHYERTITVQDVVEEWDRILAAMDQPTIDGVNTYFVSQTAREAGLTVALSGLGGDELFGGYPNTFRGVPQMVRALQLVNAIPAGPALASATVGLWPDYRRNRVLDALRRPPSRASAYLTRRGLFSPSEVQMLVLPDLWQQALHDFDPVQHIAARADDHGSTGIATESPKTAMTSWVSRAELSIYTHHQLLRDTDVMSMAHSLEVRVPLLDHRLVEAVLRLPGDVVLDGTAGPKPLLVAALGDRLPPVVRQRRGKQGFTFPFALWLRAALRSRAEAALREVQKTGWLQITALDGVVRAHQAGRAHWARLWAFVALRAAL